MNQKDDVVIASLTVAIIIVSALLVRALRKTDKEPETATRPKPAQNMPEPPGLAAVPSTPAPPTVAPPAIARGPGAWIEGTNSFSKVVHILVWAIVGLATMISAADYALSTPESAPQQAASAAMAAARVVMAYVLARAVDEILWHTARRWRADPP